MPLAIRPFTLLKRNVCRRFCPFYGRGIPLMVMFRVVYGVLVFHYAISIVCCSGNTFECCVNYCGLVIIIARRQICFISVICHSVDDMGCGV